MVWKEGLMIKLNMTGISGGMFNWKTSYFEDIYKSELEQLFQKDMQLTMVLHRAESLVQYSFPL